MRIEGKEDLAVFMTAAELAAALKLNEQSIYRFARAGIIPSIRIGRKTLRFDAEQVRKALAGKMLTSSPVTKKKRVSFRTLESVLELGAWPVAPGGLKLKRFAVNIPRKDLMTLAYERLEEDK